MKMSLTTGALLADTALYAGLLYLQGMVTYQWILYDLPNNSKAAAWQHHAHRTASHTGYQVVPVACISLLTGVLANLYVRADWASWGTLVAAVLTAVNNGTNVLNPINKAATKDKDTATVLTQVRHGHEMDMLGFCVVFVLVTFV